MIRPHPRFVSQFDLVRTRCTIDFRLFFRNGSSFLGVMYYKGNGAPQDYAEAVKWYRKAAEQGNANAQNNLGFRYYKGEDVKKTTLLLICGAMLQYPTAVFWL